MISNSPKEILEAWNSVVSGPFFESQNPPEELLAAAVPAKYLAVVKEFGGREGFIGKQYIRLYRYDELIALNQAYQLPEYNPELFIFASDGYGEAFSFVFETDTVVKIPLIPIPIDSADIIAQGFSKFLDTLASSGPSPAIDSSKVGFELHLKQPLCFGGDFRDPNNIVLVNPVKHAELARHWNKLYYDLKKEQK